MIIHFLLFCLNTNANVCVVKKMKKNTPAVCSLSNNKKTARVTNIAVCVVCQISVSMCIVLFVKFCVVFADIIQIHAAHNFSYIHKCYAFIKTLLGIRKNYHKRNY